MSPEGKMSRIFVSYSGADREFVDQLVRDLQENGHEPFYDQDVAAGYSFAKQLSASIETAEVVLLILSPEYISSPWAETEWQLAPSVTYRRTDESYLSWFETANSL